MGRHRAGPRLARSPEVRWLLLLVMSCLMVGGAASAGDPIVWSDHDADGSPRTHLYFFWSPTCPHCAEARPAVERIAERNERLVVHSHDVVTHPGSRALYVRLAESLGETARYVPAFAYCETLVQGFRGEAQLEADLIACHGRSHPPSVATPPMVDLPFAGELDLADWSLPATTIVLAGLDAFNPCAFFVLLFLLSLLARHESRARMLVVSGIFVLFSGLLYFAFMAAWLNVFLWLGELRWITIGAGAIAIAMSLLDIKDFVLGKRGPSLAIPESAKPSLFARMRRLVRASSWGSAVLGTIVLAMAANTYELLCTAGFPMVYTRVLTLADLPVPTYYLFLVLYNVVYVLPLALIVGAFVITLGSRKLQEREGRALRLLSGFMMLGLGTTLLVAPAALARVGVAVGLLAVSCLLTVVAVVLDRRRDRSKR